MASVPAPDTPSAAEGAQAPSATAPSAAAAEAAAPVAQEVHHNWNTLERLLLLFAVVKHGDENWQQISDAVNNFFAQEDPSTSRTTTTNVSPQNCQSVYTELREWEIKTLQRPAETALSSLVERFRQERIKELRKVTKDKEVLLKQLHRDITSIKTGKMDGELQAILRLPDALDLTTISAATASGFPLSSQVGSPLGDSKQRKRKLETSLSVEDMGSPTMPTESPEERLEKHRKLWELIYHHKSAGVFREPVPLAAAPDYDSVIKHRMDLGTLRSMLESGEISTTVDFAKNMNLIFSNAMTYNSKGSQIYNMAQTLKGIFKKELEKVFGPGADLPPKKRKGH